MTPDQLLLLAVLVSSTTLYITRWIPTEVTALLTVAVLAFTGLLSADQAISGFSSTATITVAAMFILSGGLMRTGALEVVTVFLARLARSSLQRLLFSIGGITAAASAFMNNTPVVVMMVPVMLSLSNQLKIRPSKLLIPLSYFCILGGTMTLLGTSTNILLDDLYRKAGGPGFALFEFMPLGIIYTFVGLIYIVFVGQRLLPNRAPLLDLVSQRQQTPYITELVVGPDSNVDGESVGNVFSRIATMERTPPPTVLHRHRRIGRPPRSDSDEEDGSRVVELLQVVRGQRSYRAEETALLRLAQGDVLIVAGTPGAIKRLMDTTGMHLAPVLEDGTRVPVEDVERKVCEAVVLPDSSFAGQLIGELELNRRYGVKIMGLQHNGRQRITGLRDMRLSAGDVLLLQAHSHELHAASEGGKLLLVEGIESAIPRTTKNRQALVIMLAVVLLASLSPIPIVVLAIAGAALLIVTKCLRMDEALRSLDSGTLFLLAGTIPVGLAMETTGLAQLAVDGLVQVAGDASPVFFVSIFYLITSILTSLISNNAVAVLLTPIALNLAMRLGMDPAPLLVAVAFGASASFMTPMGYQTNAIVMGPGGYTFADYLRVGAPLNFLLWLMASVAIPFFWPVG